MSLQSYLSRFGSQKTFFVIFTASLIVLQCIPHASALACGNSVVEGTEECDNGNQRGCTTNCLRDPAFYCAGTPSTCTRGFPIALTGSGVLTLSGTSAVDTAALANAIATAAGNSVSASDISIPTSTITSTGTGWNVPFTITFAGSNAGVVPAVGANLRALGTTLTNARVTAISFSNVCGNQQLELGETCEFVNGFTDGCSSSCTASSGYVCRANLVSSTVSGVTTQYQVCSLCSNGILNTGTSTQVATEQCDDGNVNPGDGCGRECLVESGFVCTTNSVFKSVCTVGTVTAVCGNGVVQTGEACDDGNNVNGDGCSSACAVESGFTCTINASTGRSVCVVGTFTCGNGVVQTGEACDDGNFVNGDGCTSACVVESGFICVTNTAGKSVCALSGGTCGNGLVQTNEACDDGNLVSGDGCSINCVVESGFVCVTNTAGRSVCSASGLCGNGVVNSGESCDDANLVNGDGCSSACLVESGFICSTSSTGRSVCARTSSTCGNGVLQTGEGCDDGNLVNGDGCSSACAIESGFSCLTTSGRSICSLISTSVCGNGVVNTGEGCDDGNRISGDGCSSSCGIESGFTCLANAVGLSVCSLASVTSVTSLFSTAFDGGDDDSDNLWWLITLLVLLGVLLCLALFCLLCRRKKRRIPRMVEAYPVAPVEPKAAPLYVHPPPEIQPAVRYEVYDTY